MSTPTKLLQLRPYSRGQTEYWEQGRVVMGRVAEASHYRVVDGSL